MFERKRYYYIIAIFALSLLITFGIRAACFYGTAVEIEIPYKTPNE